LLSGLHLSENAKDYNLRGTLMQIPPYNHLMQELKSLVEKDPILLGPTLLPVIAYLGHTNNIYDQFVLDNLDKLDDDEDDEPSYLKY
jgi:hypothetical protein